MKKITMNKKLKIVFFCFSIIATLSISVLGAIYAAEKNHPQVPANTDKPPTYQPMRISDAEWEEFKRCSLGIHDVNEPCHGLLPLGGVIVSGEGYISLSPTTRIGVLSKEIPGGMKYDYEIAFFESGSLKNEPAQGYVLWGEGLSAVTLSPSKSGALRIVSREGNYLTLVSTKGEYLRFNMITLKFE